MGDHKFSRLELERQADANRIRELETETEELQAEIERLRAELIEARRLRDVARKMFDEQDATVVQLERERDEARKAACELAGFNPHVGPLARWDKKVAEWRRVV